MYLEIQLVFVENESGLHAEVLKGKGIGGGLHLLSVNIKLKKGNIGVLKERRHEERKKSTIPEKKEDQDIDILFFN